MREAEVGIKLTDRNYGTIRGMDGFSQDNLAAAFAENRQRLSALTEKRLNPILLKRLNVEDVLSEAYANAAKRLAYFATILSVTKVSSAATLDLIDEPANALGGKTFATSPISSAKSFCATSSRIYAVINNYSVILSFISNFP